MAKSRTTSARGKKKKAAAPPPPPPVLIRVDDIASLHHHVLDFEGSVLLGVVTPVSTVCTSQIVPFLEKLNNERPPALKETNLVVVYATDTNADVCQALEVFAVPCFFAYAYGQCTGSFAGGNSDKAVLLAMIASKAAGEEQQRRVEEAKANAAAAAAAAEAEAQQSPQEGAAVAASEAAVEV